jgi:hypothetical protein
VVRNRHRINTIEFHPNGLIYTNFSLVTMLSVQTIVPPQSDGTSKDGFPRKQIHPGNSFAGVD